jgi:hypothetical protein
MKLTNAIFNDTKFFESVRKINDFSGFSAKDAYRLHRLSKELTTRAEAYNTIRTKLLEKHGTKDEEAGQFKFDPSKAREFESEFNDLLSIEFELDFNKIPFPDDLVLSPSEINSVEWLFDFSEFEKEDVEKTKENDK